MHRFSMSILFALLALIAGLLAAGCSAEDTPTPLPTPTSTPCPCFSTHCATGDPCPQVGLLNNFFNADLPIADTVYLGDFVAGEEINVTLMAEDGSQAPIGTAIADAVGMAAVDFRHDGLAEGLYAVTAVGSQGGKDSTAFFVK